MNKKLQVFVSSTYTDLIEERQAAVEAILDAGHIPAGMELFKAGKSQMKTIRKWIDESDVYMLILGGRYGSIEEDSGLSYTELEYRYALSKNMPVFAVVLNESFLFTKAASMGKDTIFEKDNINKYDTFKHFVKNQIVIFINNIDQICGKIHAQLNNILTDPEYNLIGWTRNIPNNYQITETSFNIDRLYLLKLIDIFQSKTCETLYSTTTNITHRINAIDIFSKYYNNFCIGVEKPSKLDRVIYIETLCDSMCPYFENFGLLKFEKNIYKITGLGNSFYSLLESKNML